MFFNIFNIHFLNIKKIIDCYNKNLGCSVYECPHCHDIIFVGHTCKSRFCSSCGYKYKNERVENIMQTAYNCQHRQIVFTIPEQLRKY
ncbi:MAG: transposase zinc-binding domain-containing protein, partial [Clostridia bacterium]|nr:transposase zinc-binding domain-containing protein [Clostridia bacterium]